MKNQLTEFYTPGIISISENINKTTKVYDIVYVLNLDRSKDRLITISNQLEAAGVTYQRFPAIDGYNVNFTNIDSNQQFSGKDIASNKIIINKDTTYKVFCTPNLELNNSFSISGDEYSLNSGEFGIWCSYKMIWKDIVKNGYKNSIILEEK